MNTRLIRLRRSLYSLAAFFFRHVILFILILLAGLLLILGQKTRSLLVDTGLGKVDILTFFRSQKQILENTGDRTNFLILGVRGEGDDSPDLTDTMLVISYSHSDNQASLISIPRDLWVNSLKTKINSVYHYGRFRESRGGGILLAQSAVLETLGLPIHYTAVVDFSLFRQAIDLVGGVTVDVAAAFTDDQFPIEGKEDALPVSARYETISFAKGPQAMDGVLALKFVRSRHAPGDEGTDIARDRRQQLVIGALIQKIKNPSFFLKSQKIISLYRLVNDHLETNLSPDLYPALVRLAFDSYRHSPEKIALSYLPDEDGVSILENPPVSSLYQNQWVLIARDNNWSALAQYLQNKLEKK
jgi:LCP family protein required for cell wall assembly